MHVCACTSLYVCMHSYVGVWDKFPFVCVSAHVCVTYQAFRQRSLVSIRQMLLQSQDNTVGTDGGQDQPLKRSERVLSRKKTGSR